MDWPTSLQTVISWLCTARYGQFSEEDFRSESKGCWSDWLLRSSSRPFLSRATLFIQRILQKVCRNFSYQCKGAQKSSSIKTYLQFAERLVGTLRQHTCWEAWKFGKLTHYGHHINRWFPAKNWEPTHSSRIQACDRWLRQSIPFNWQNPFPFSHHTMVEEEDLQFWSMQFFDQLLESGFECVLCLIQKRYFSVTRWHSNWISFCQYYSQHLPFWIGPEACARICRAPLVLWEIHRRHNCCNIARKRNFGITNQQLAWKSASWIVWWECSQFFGFGTLVGKSGSLLEFVLKAHEFVPVRAGG